MNEVETFLAAAIRLEREAALRYDELADAITGLGNAEVVAFFRQQAVFSRRHLEEAKARAGFREPLEGVDPIDPRSKEVAADVSSSYPSGESPEAAAIWAADGNLSLVDAMKVAYAAEVAGRDYYLSVATSTTDPEVKVLADEFVEEENEHVAALEVLMGKYIKG